MRLKRRDKDVWTPYGHEKARKRLLAERRVQIIVAAVALAILYAVIIQLTSETVTAPNRQGFEIPEPERKPVTVGVTPGGVPAFARPGQETPDPEATPQAKHERNEWLDRLQPILQLIAPLVAAFWLLGKAGASARGKLAELNFGIYKGAMPYEMHIARGRSRVFTHREVEGHVFGKKREDYVFGTYLKEPPLAVRQMLGMTDNDRAEVTRLKHGSAKKAK
ncbi:MAG: hypothetical protein KY455_04840 [Euryarchaeota archaeon]|nr:hypothetical protein [Euryarchaeota archaeon]